MIVRGSARFDGPVPPDAAALVVRLIDVSRADAASETVAQTVIPDVRGGRPVAFEMTATGVRPRHHYAVQAHLDVDGTGTITPGDYLTMQSFPVDPRLSEATVDVTLRFVPP